MSRARLITAAVVVAVAAVAGVIAAGVRQHPTGDPTIDAVIRGAGVALIVLIASRAPWWVAAIAAGTALAIAVDPPLMVLALVGLGLVVWLGSTHRDRPELVAVSVGLTFNILVRSRLDEPFALSAFITGLVAAVLLVAGLQRWSGRPRRLLWVGVGVLVLAAGAATVGFGAAAAQARHDLADGRNSAELGVSSLESGDYEAAEQWFREAATYLQRAHQRLTEPWASGATFIPVVAHYRDAAVDLSRVAADGADTVADALADVDLDSLRAVDGRIDLDALESLEEPLMHVRNALVQLKAVTDASRSPWFVHRVDIELDDFDESVDEHLPGIENALEAIRLAPELRGVDGPRRYLVLFTTPAESRGLGGFVGNYAELTADDGRLTMSRFGRAQELDRAAEKAGARVRGHEDFLAQYGMFGFDTDGSGTVGDAAFRNLTMTPNFPWVGEIAADLYAQTTGRTVDGTLAMDPYVLARLVDYAGAVRLTSLDELLTGDTTAPFLLRDQYVLATDITRRTDALAEAARLAFDSLLGGTLPDPPTLARDLAPLVGERRLLMWTANPEEQALLERVHMAGRIPPLDGADGWSVTVSNAAGNKIDSFLERRASYEHATDPASGQRTATLRVELTNTAPAEGYPPYVIGNQIGAPPGTSRLYVSFYSALGLESATLDGEATELTTGLEEGWNVYSGFVDIPPGGTVAFELHLRGSVAHPDQIVTWEQPMATPLELPG
jgi:Protein of unknown function (DUF4012)